MDSFLPSQPLHPRIIQRFLHHRGHVPLAEVFHLDLGAGLGVGAGQVAVQDELAHAVAVVGAGNVPHAVAVGKKGFVAQGHTAVVERQAAQLFLQRLVLQFQAGVTANEVAFLQAHRPAQASFVGGIFGVDVAAPQPVPFFQAQRVKRAHPGGNHFHLAACFPEQIPGY